MTIKELGDSFFCLEFNCLVRRQPYISFIIMSVILEFIGKCIRVKAPSDFNKSGNSSHDCTEAINNLKALECYRQLNEGNRNLIYTSIRCGMLHSFVPNEGLKLTYRHNDFKNNIIGAVDFYNSLKDAWEEVKANENYNNLLNLQKIDTQDRISGTTETQY